MPIRVELGPKDIAKGEVVAVRRLTGEKLTLKRANAAKQLVNLLEKTHDEMFAKYVHIYVLPLTILIVNADDGAYDFD